MRCASLPATVGSGLICSHDSLLTRLYVKKKLLDHGVLAGRLSYSCSSLVTAPSVVRTTGRRFFRGSCWFYCLKVRGHGLWLFGGHMDSAFACAEKLLFAPGKLELLHVPYSVQCWIRQPIQLMRQPWRLSKNFLHFSTKTWTAARTWKQDIISSPFVSDCHLFGVFVLPEVYLKILISGRRLLDTFHLRRYA